MFRDEFNGDELNPRYWISKKISEKNKIMFINEYSIVTNISFIFN